MNSTTNFEEWLGSGNDPDDHESAYALYNAANGQSMGYYDVDGDEDRLFIKGPAGDTLTLVSPKAIAAFRKHLDKYKNDPNMDWEIWYQFHRAMAKVD